MFSSLASFLFGSNTPATTNCQVNQNPSNQQQQSENQVNVGKDLGTEEAENTIEVTSSTPSVTGSNSANSSSIQQGKRGKNKRTRNSNKNKRQSTTNGSAGAGQRKPTSSIAKLLTPNDSLDEDFEDEDWFIVEKEEEGEDESLPRTDSEEEVSVVEIKQKLTTPACQQSRRHHYHINSHSLYSGPRPQQQRNFLQRARNSGARVSGPLNASILNPSRNIGSLAVITSPNGLADGGMTQSLYVASSSNQPQHNVTSNNDNFNGANISMEESWFVTPPPCFTSVGPINMETSPFENLLIEHPSMSVYHSIRSAQEATESFVNLDLGVNEQRRSNNNATAVATIPRNPQSIQQRPSGGGSRMDRQTAAQLKQELMARSTQKNREKKERQKLCATAMKRSNAAREFQSKGNRPRRADLQHYRVNSGANNNRNTSSRKAFF